MTITARSFLGSALVSNTMVCEVSRLLTSGERSSSPDRENAARTDQLRLFDLFSLIGATVIVERLYTFPLRLPLVEEFLPLPKTLIETGILVQLDTSPDHNLLAE